MEPTTLIIIAILFLATLARFTLGFGDALVAMPLLLFVVSNEVAAPLVSLLAVTVASLLMITEWRNIHFQSAWRLVLPGFVGIYIGLQYLLGANEQVVVSLLAVVVIVFALYSLIGPKQIELKSENSALVFGFFAGLLGGAYNTHGPPLVIYGTLRHWPIERFRATLQGYFLPASIVVICGHAWNGRLSGEIFDYYLLSLPLTLVSLFIGKRISSRVDHKTFSRVVNWFLVAVGAVLLVKAFG